MQVVWELYKDFYVPMGICAQDAVDAVGLDGVNVQQLNDLIPSNPYAVYMDEVTRLRNRIPNRTPDDDTADSDTVAANKKQLALLLEPLEGLRSADAIAGALNPVTGARRQMIRYRIEAIGAFQTLVNRIADRWDELGLHTKYELGNKTYNIEQMPIAEEWLKAWRKCVASLSSNVRTFTDTMNMPDNKPFDILKFMDRWGTTPSKPLSPAPIQGVQVLTDHSQVERSLELTRALHDVEVNAVVEFVLQFDADETVLRHALELIPRKIGEIDMSEVQVKDNALVYTVSVPLGSGSPVAKSLSKDALERKAASADRLNKCMAKFIQAMDDLWEDAEE